MHCDEASQGHAPAGRAPDGTACSPPLEGPAAVPAVPAAAAGRQAGGRAGRQAGRLGRVRRGSGSASASASTNGSMRAKARVIVQSESCKLWPFHLTLRRRGLTRATFLPPSYTMGSNSSSSAGWQVLHSHQAGHSHHPAVPRGSHNAAGRRQQAAGEGCGGGRTRSCRRAASCRPANTKRLPLPPDDES